MKKVIFMIILTALFSNTTNVSAITKNQKATAKIICGIILASGGGIGFKYFQTDDPGQTEESQFLGGILNWVQQNPQFTMKNFIDNWNANLNNVSNTTMKTLDDLANFDDSSNDKGFDWYGNKRISVRTNPPTRQPTRNMLELAIKNEKKYRDKQSQSRGFININLKQFGSLGVGALGISLIINGIYELYQEEESTEESEQQPDEAIE